MTQADRPRILVVDDERGPRESLRMILGSSHDVLLAEHGSEALEVLRSGPIDLVTLDLNMPGLKGNELMRTIRSEFPGVEVIVVTGYATLESATEGIRVGICDYLQKPFDVVQVTASVHRALSRRRGRLRMVEFLENLAAVVGRDRNVSAIAEKLQANPTLTERVEQVFQSSPLARAEAGVPPRTFDFLEVLAETIESQDEFLRGHARRVAFYAGLLADRLCLSTREQEQVRVAAFLHDLGKVGVPSDLLMRPGALDASERRVVERHPAIGVRLVRPLGISSAIAAAIRHHHERWDGRGYPDGLQGEQIPLVARIVGLADAFDAMTSDRPYRRALDQEAVRQELEGCAGSQFDPTLAKEFLNVVTASSVDFALLTQAISVSTGSEPAGSSV